MSDEKRNIQFHNVAVRHHMQYHEYESNFKSGERFKIAGTYRFNLDRDDHMNSEINEFDRKQKEANYQINTWGTVYRDTIEGGTVSLAIENIYGYTFHESIDQTALKAMIIEGNKIESARLALESRIAWQAVQEGLSPKYEALALEQLYKDGKLDIGTPLVIDGVPFGVITDAIVDDGHILVKTDLENFLFSNVDFRNEFNKLNNNCYYHDNELLLIQSQEPVPKDDVLGFILDNHDKLPLKPHRNDVGISGSEFVKKMSADEAFMKRIGLRMADYMQKNAVSDIIHTNNKSVINDLVEMVKCEMYDSGYYHIPKERPSQEALSYIQSLGYTEAAMAEKAEILGRWMKEKNLTDEEMIVAKSIVDNKILHVIKDIDLDSIRAQRDFSLLELYRKLSEYESYHPIYELMVYDGKCTATHINLALNTQDREVVKLPKFNERESIGSYNSDMQIGYTENDIYVTFDVSEEYERFGGFDYNRALEQTMGKSQKQDEPEITNPDQPTIEEEPPTIGGNR